LKVPLQVLAAWSHEKKKSALVTAWFSGLQPGVLSKSFENHLKCKELQPQVSCTTLIIPICNKALEGSNLLCKIPAARSHISKKFASSKFQ
jgi:hypothetical protein